MRKGTNNVRKGKLLSAGGGENKMADNIGRIIKQRRHVAELTLHELSALSEVSTSHLDRIERGERFPSARILHKIARPLGIGESELFMIAGYLSPPIPGGVEEKRPRDGVDPYVAKILSQEPAEVQHAVVGILTILKDIVKSMLKEEADH